MTKCVENQQHLLDLYDQLLGRYGAILESSELNPYAPVLKSVFIGCRFKYWKRIFHSGRQFLRLPNALKQGLVGCVELMDELANETQADLNCIAIINQINLEQLHRRTIINRFLKMFGPLSGFLGLGLAGSTYYGVEIPLLKELFALPIAFLVFAGGANFIVLWSRIELVRAFGDIVRIEKSRREEEP